MNLSKDVKVTRIMSAVVAGTTDSQAGTVLDMSGFDGVVFIVSFGALTATAVTDIRAQESITDVVEMGDPADLAGTKVSVVAATDSNKVAILDVYRPLKRYIRCLITRATANAVVDGIIAIQYKGRKTPVTHDTATVVSAELHVSPIAGTA